MTNKKYSLDIGIKHLVVLMLPLMILSVIMVMMWKIIIYANMKD